MLFSIFFFCIGIAMVFMGTANKIGFSESVLLFSDKNAIESIYSNLLLRVSTSYMSLQNVLLNHFFDFDFQIDTFINSWNNFIQKLSIIIPFSENVGDTILLSVNRTNFLTLYIPYNNHAGTSPGLLASIFYLPLFPFSMFIMVIYTLSILNSINRYFQDINSPNIITLIFVIFIWLTLFESPLNMLNIVNPVVIYTLSCYLGSYLCKKT